MTVQSNDRVRWGGRLSESAKASEVPFIAIIALLLFVIAGAITLVMHYRSTLPPPAPAQVAQPSTPTNDGEPLPQPPQVVQAQEPPQELQAPEQRNNETLFREFQWYRKGMEAKQ